MHVLVKIASLRYTFRLTREKEQLVGKSSHADNFGKAASHTLPAANILQRVEIWLSPISSLPKKNPIPEKHNTVCESQIALFLGAQNHPHVLHYRCSLTNMEKTRGKYFPILLASGGEKKSDSHSQNLWVEPQIVTKQRWKELHDLGQIPVLFHQWDKRQFKQGLNPAKESEMGMQPQPCPLIHYIYDFLIPLYMLQIPGVQLHDFAIPRIYMLMTLSHYHLQKDPENLSNQQAVLMTQAVTLSTHMGVSPIY